MLINVLKSPNDACPYGFFWRQKAAKGIKFDEIISHFWSLPFDLKVWCFLGEQFITVLASHTQRHLNIDRIERHLPFESNAHMCVTMVTIQIATMCVSNGWNCDCSSRYYYWSFVYDTVTTHMHTQTIQCWKCLSSEQYFPESKRSKKKTAVSFQLTVITFSSIQNQQSVHKSRSTASSTFYTFLFINVQWDEVNWG